MTKFDVYISVLNHEKDGRQTLISKERANSLVLQIIDLLAVHIQQTTLTISDTGGTPRSVIYTTSTFALNAAAASSAQGLVLGIGTNAVTLADVALQTQIAHGNGSGQLSYGTTTFTAPTTVGSTRSFEVQRTFINNSGADITVKEVGLYAKATAGATYYCIDRTLKTFTITNGATVTVKYTISVTV